MVIENAKDNREGTQTEDLIREDDGGGLGEDGEHREEDKQAKGDSRKQKQAQRNGGDIRRR